MLNLLAEQNKKKRLICCYWNEATGMNSVVIFLREEHTYYRFKWSKPKWIFLWYTTCILLLSIEKLCQNYCRSFPQIYKKIRVQLTCLFQVTVCFNESCIKYQLQKKVPRMKWIMELINTRLYTKNKWLINGLKRNKTNSSYPHEFQIGSLPTLLKLPRDTTVNSITAVSSRSTAKSLKINEH